MTHCLALKTLIDELGELVTDKCKMALRSTFKYTISVLHAVSNGGCDLVHCKCLEMLHQWTIKINERSLQYLVRAAQLYLLQPSRFSENSTPPDGVTVFIWASGLDVRF